MEDSLLRRDKINQLIDQKCDFSLNVQSFTLFFQMIDYIISDKPFIMSCYHSPEYFIVQKHLDSIWKEEVQLSENGKDSMKRFNIIMLVNVKEFVPLGSKSPSSHLQQYRSVVLQPSGRDFSSSE